jgi:NAD(P)-dependent dehydrogenase (short-subunit alcohol dehydrogenase family)
MKTWFITGASRGFGALIAERALAKGDGVVATAQNPKTITERFGEHPNLLAVALDVTVENQALAAAKRDRSLWSDRHPAQQRRLRFDGRSGGSQRR